MQNNALTISNNEKIGILSNLTTMLSAGISILDAMDALLEGTKGNQKKLLGNIRNDLTEGKRLNAAFARFPRVFDDVTVNLIKAAEEAGSLETTLKDLKKTIMKEAELGDQIKATLMYPLVVMVVFSGVLFVILIVVIPRISTIFLQMKLHLPITTRILIYVSNGLVKNPFWVFSYFTILFILLSILYKQQKQIIMNILFSAPFVSKLVKKIDLTRFTRSLAILIGSGIPITVALQLTEKIVFKKEVQKVIRHAQEMVLSGKKLSDGFRLYPHVIPTIMVRISEAGERSGTLDNSMQDVSEYLDYEVTKELKTLTALLEPILLVIIGLLVGGIIFSIIVPIYSLMGSIGK